MARQKLPEEEKKKDFSVSINIKLDKKLEKYLESKGISNKSKYIEKLVKDDMKNRGENIQEEF